MPAIKKALYAKLDPDSLNKLADKLEKYADLVSGRYANTLVQLLAKDGAETAQARFYGDVVVDYEAEGNGKATLRATGSQVVFQEFGAGAAMGEIHQTSDNPLAPGAQAALGIDISRGAYSDAVQGEYQKTGYKYWHHEGDLYTQIVPVHGLAEAEETMIANVTDRAKEAFNR